MKNLNDHSSVALSGQNSTLGPVSLVKSNSLADQEFDLLQLDGAESEELEARKILTKRRRRVGKIEDIQIDIDALFATKKRFKPDESTNDSISLAVSTTGPIQPTFDEAISEQTKSLMRQNLLAQYMEQVGEHDVAN